MGAGGAGVSGGADAHEFAPVVWDDGAVLLGHAGGAVFARTIFASLTSQFAEAAVVTDGTSTLVRTGRRRCLLGETEREKKRL